MDFLTHAMMGCLIARLWATKRVGADAAVLGALSGLVPDLDGVLFLGGAGAFLRFGHAATHSLVFGVLYAALAARLANAVSARKSYATYFWVALLAFLSHVLLDTLTPFGTEYLWPFLGRRFTGDLIWYVDPWISGVAFLALVLGCLPGQGPRFALFGVALICGYLGGCTVVHQLALDLTRHESDALPHVPGQHNRIEALPEPRTPFAWRGMVRTTNHYHCFEWRSFSGRPALVEVHTKLIEDEWVKAARQNGAVGAFWDQARYPIVVRNRVDAPSTDPQGWKGVPNHHIEFADLQFSDRSGTLHLVMHIEMDEQRNVLDHWIEWAGKEEGQ